MIYAGNIDDISWSNGIWLILDIGFSNKSRSCGLLLHDNEAESLLYSEAVDKVIMTCHQYEALNLVIEAPLSVAFDSNGNPKGRDVEQIKSANRYWYVGAGAVVSLATLHLMKRLLASNPENCFENAAFCIVVLLCRFACCCLGR